MQLHLAFGGAHHLPLLTGLGGADHAALHLHIRDTQIGGAAGPAHGGGIEPLDVLWLIRLGDAGAAAIGRDHKIVGLHRNGAGLTQTASQRFGAGILGQIGAILRARIFQRAAVQAGRLTRHAGGEEVGTVRAQTGQSLAVMIVRAVLAIGRHVAPVVVGHAHRNHQPVAELIQLFVGEVALDLVDVVEAHRLGFGIQAVAEFFPTGGVVVDLRLHAQIGLVGGGQITVGTAPRIRAGHHAVRLRIGRHAAAHVLGAMHEIAVVGGIAQRVVGLVTEIPVPAGVEVALHLVQTADDVERGIRELLTGAEGQRHVAQLEGLNRHCGLLFHASERGGAVAVRYRHPSFGQ